MDRKTAKEKLAKELGINKQNSEVEEALSRSKKPTQRLGQGVIEDKFYYGTSLTFRNHPISAVITSEKKCYLGYTKNTYECKKCGEVKKVFQFNLPSKILPRNCKCKKKMEQEWELIDIYNPIKNDLGLNYRTEFNEDSLDYIWSTESIKEFLEGKYKKKNIREIYEEIIDINKKYIDHLNPISHKYTTCWIIGTNCYTLFEQFGRIYNRADRGSGKTKQARIIKNLVFNPMWITKGTESSIFRDAEATCGTFIVDNMDKLHEDLKRSIEHVIETGWMYDATYRLTNKDTGRTQKFLSYSPMALNNIFGLDDNTVDKTFEILMLKSINKKINKSKPTVKSEDWERIRNDLRYWALDNWQDIRKTYEKINASFSGREFDVVEGVLTIAKMIGDDVYEEIEEYCKEKLEEELIDLENNNAYLVFSSVWKKFLDNPIMQENNIYLSDISSELFEKFNPALEFGTKEYSNRKKGFSKYLAKIIRSVPMFRKGGLSMGRTYIRFQRKHLNQYMKLQHFINEDGTLLTSTTSTTSTKLPKPTKDIVDVVEQSSLVEQDMRVEKDDQKGNSKPKVKDFKILEDGTEVEMVKVE